MAMLRRYRPGASVAGNISSMRRIATLLAVVCFLCAAHSQPAQAQDATGNWQGALTIGTIEFRVAMQVWKASNGDLAGKITFTDTGGKTLSVTDISVKNRRSNSESLRHKCPL
jgi:hypothetical protein